MTTKHVTLIVGGGKIVQVKPSVFAYPSTDVFLCIHLVVCVHIYKCVCVCMYACDLTGPNSKQTNKLTNKQYARRQLTNKPPGMLVGTSLLIYHLYQRINAFEDKLRSLTARRILKNDNDDDGDDDDDDDEHLRRSRSVLLFCLSRITSL